MAHLNVSPAGQALNWVAGLLNSNMNSAPNPAKYVPKNADGTVKDNTALTGLTMTIAKTQFANSQFDITHQITPTMVIHDATGVTCTFATVDPQAVAQALGQSGSFFYTITGTTGTDDYAVGSGTLNIATIV